MMLVVGSVIGAQAVDENLQEIVQELIIAADAGPLRMMGMAVKPLGAGDYEHGHGVYRVDVGAEYAGALGLPDPFSTQRNELTLALAAGGVTFHVDPAEQAHHLRVCAEKPEVAGHGAAQEQFVSHRGVFQLRLLLLDVARERLILDGFPQRFLATKMVVNQALGYTLAFGNLAHCDIGEALLDKKMQRSFKDSAPRQFGVTCLGFIHGRIILLTGRPVN